MSNVSYHWEIETVDECGNIVVRNFLESLTSVELGPHEHLALARCGWRRIGCVKQWAYVVDGKLPERFCNVNGNLGNMVPLTFHQELERVIQCI